MVSVSICESKGSITQVSARGHAQHSPPGDIVCSAVSALFFTLLGALSNLPEVEVKWQQKEGFMEIKLIGGVKSQEAQAVMKAIITGLKQVALKYPTNVSVVE